MNRHPLSHVAVFAVAASIFSLVSCTSSDNNPPMPPRLPTPVPTATPQPHPHPGIELTIDGQSITLPEIQSDAASYSGKKVTVISERQTPMSEVLKMWGQLQELGLILEAGATP